MSEACLAVRKVINGFGGGTGGSTGGGTTGVISYMVVYRHVRWWQQMFVIGVVTALG